MATTNLFSQPGVQGRRVHRQRSRRCGGSRWRKTLDAIDLGVELGADGLRDVGRPRGRRGRRGQGRPARARPLQGGGRPLLRVRPRPRLRHALRARAEAQRAARRHPAARRSGTRSRSSSELEWPDMVGLNPEFAHETMSGCRFTPRGRADAVAREALPHRPQRASGSASTTRTSGSAPRASATRSTS